MTFLHFERHSPRAMLATVYFSLIGATLLLLLLWFLRPDWGVRSQFDLFVLIWAYYALCVPVDLLFGLTAEGPLLLPDLNEPKHFETVVQVTLYYYSLAAGYLIAYRLLSHEAASETRTAIAAPFWWVKVPVRHLPPLWLVLGLILLALAVYVGAYDGIDRSARGDAARGDAAVRLLNLATTRLSYAACIILIVLLPEKHRARWVVATGMLASVLTGSRNAAAFLLLSYLIRHDVILSLRLRLMLAGGGLAFAIFLKATYVYFANLLILGRHLPPGDLLSGRIDAGISLSRLEGIGGYAWPVYFIEQGPSPMWLGWSYIEIAVMKTLPSFLTGRDVPTLSLMFSPEVVPNWRLDPSGRAFSAIAEAWLNFGSIGPLVIGALLGVAAKILDTGPRGLFFMLFGAMTARFFRSDFASTFNSNIIVTGSMVALVYVLFVAWQHVAPRVRLGAAS